MKLNERTYMSLGLAAMLAVLLAWGLRLEGQVYAESAKTHAELDQTVRRQDRQAEFILQGTATMQSIDRRLSRIEGKLGINE